MDNAPATTLEKLRKQTKPQHSISEQIEAGPPLWFAGHLVFSEPGTITLQDIDDANSKTIIRDKDVLEIIEDTHNGLFLVRVPHSANVILRMEAVIAPGCLQDSGHGFGGMSVHAVAQDDQMPSRPKVKGICYPIKTCSKGKFPFSFFEICTVRWVCYPVTHV